jgi:ribonuclease HII
MRTKPTFEIENEYPNMIVAGTDEAGRGPLSGPVVAAAVIMPRHMHIDSIINDSKQMTKKAREASYKWITENATWAIGMCAAEEIDEINILRASMRAMGQAIHKLSTKPDFVLVDGNKVPDEITNGRAVVKGDAKSISIAAASIVAKVTRDRIMTELAKEFPEYDWDKNAGYPTKKHFEALAKYGPTPHHRKTFNLTPPICHTAA